MRRSLLSLTVLALALLACGDEPTKESAITPKTAKPSAAVAATPGADGKAGAKAGAAKAGAAKPSLALRSASARSSAPSTVCTRYHAQLNASKAKLAAAPNVAALKTKVSNLETLVSDACQ